MLILRQVAAVVVLACAVCGAEAQPVEGGFKPDYLDPLLSGSCPQGARPREPDAIDIRVAQVPLQMLNPMRKTIGQLSFVGGFHLTSKDKRW